MARSFALEDLSGYLVADEDWLNAGDLPQTLIDLLGEVGRIYVPYLIGNAEAVTEGAEKVQMTLDGRPWEQNPFPYQAKCLRWLKDEYANLEEADRTRIANILGGTGCEVLLDE